MCKEMYDITEGDLNPEFLFTCVSTRTEEEQNYEVEEGDFILLNPGTYHRSKAGYSKEGLKECYIAFSGVSFKGCKSGYFPSFKGNGKIIKMADRMKKNIFQICTVMNKEARECSAGRYFMLKAYLIQILCLVVREQKEAYHFSKLFKKHYGISPLYYKKDSFS